MPTFTDGPHYSAKAAVDLSAKRFFICKTDANGKIVLSSAGTDKHLGVIADGGRQIADAVDVQLINGDGTFKVVVGATPVAKDAELTSDANGKAVAASSGDQVIGWAMAAAAAGAQVEYIKKDYKKA